MLGTPIRVRIPDVLSEEKFLEIKEFLEEHNGRFVDDTSKDDVPSTAVYVAFPDVETAMLFKLTMQ